MFTKKQLKLELERNIALKNLTEIYEDVAVVGMQSVRHQVVTNRIFLEGVSAVYYLAKTSFLKQISQIPSQKARLAETAFLRRNKKTVVVLISGNQTLLGNVLIKTFKMFLDVISKTECDYVVMGKVGAYLLRNANLPKPFVEFPLDDYGISDAKAKLALQFINRYEKILVVYPKFLTVLSQEPRMDDISGGGALEQVEIKSARNYFFEPTAKDVMAYFEDQIIEALFRQKLLESVLARYGARLSIMDRATKRIGGIIDQNNKLRKIIERSDANKKLFGQFSGMLLWGDNLK